MIKNKYYMYIKIIISEEIIIIYEEIIQFTLHLIVKK